MDFNDLAINLNDELDDLSAKSIPKPIQNSTVTTPTSNDSTEIKPVTAAHYQHGDVNSGTMIAFNTLFFKHTNLHHIPYMIYAINYIWTI